MATVFTIITLATIIVLAIMMVKYKFVYKVTISGHEVGYVTNKYEFKEQINEKVIYSSNANVVDVDEETLPTYQLVLADNSVETNEEEIIAKASDEAVITYKVYAIAVNDNNTAYVNTIEEAEDTVSQIKEDYEEDDLEEIDISVNEVYTKNIDEIEEVVETDSIIETVKEEVEIAVEEQVKIAAATLDGVYFSTKPVTGTITSRYGSYESIRSHAHSGLDIAAPAGTDIVAASGGTVSYSGWMGGYGNLIIIDHENGIQTYYGHCSKLYAKVGDEVEAGDLIAAVGTTGYSTGNHLHFEIRKNGSTLNPQTYIYN